MRHSIRSLAATPGFTVVAVLTLALGIGATTAIFSVVNGVLLRPLDYPGADRIVQVWTTAAEGLNEAHGPADFLAFQQRTHTLKALAGYREEPLTIAPDGGEPIRTTGGLVTLDFFHVLGTPPLLGRVFDRTVDAATTAPLAIVSHGTWRDTLGANPGVVGRFLRINGVPHTIVGVMPKGFDYPLGAGAWVLSPRPVPPPPIDVEGDLLAQRDVRYFYAIGRLHDGVTLAQAQAELSAIAADLDRAAAAKSARGVLVERLHDRIVGDVQQALLLLFAAVGVVLLIACANVASLLLARATARQREFAIRAALGATRGTLIRQLLAESLVLATAAGAVGLLIGMWAVQGLIQMMPEGVPRIEEIGLNARVGAVSLGVALLSAVVFGLVPALQASRTNAATALRDSGDRASTTARGGRTRAAVVVVELALTLVLLVSAGLLANSFLRLQSTDPGFATREVVLVELPLPQAKYADGKAQAAFDQRLLEGLATRGEIETAAVAFPNPLAGSNATGAFSIEGRPPTRSSERPRANLAAISPDYLGTMGIPLIAGRHFTERDREPAPTPIIVNATFARRYWPGEDALGKRLRFDDDEETWMTVVGIAADSRNRGLELEPQPLMYIPYHVFPLPFMSLVARSPGGTAAVAAAVRGEVRRLDPDLPVDPPRPLDDVLRASVAEPRFRAMLLGLFAVTALALAAIGLYGLISYSVAQRTREIGIRVALGAQPGEVIWPIVREGLVLALAGVGVGVMGALVVTKILAAFLFGVTPTDPLTFALVSAGLLGVALLASYIPSRRAARVDPLEALRAP